MTTANSLYFHTASLRQRYFDALDHALTTKRISAQERFWLQALARTPGVNDPDPARVDRLMSSQAAFEPFELRAALLVSHAVTDDARMYLFTLADGIEVFSDRHALATALRPRFVESDDSALIEYELIEADPFRAQMLAIVDHQVDHLEQLSAQLRMTPSLTMATDASIAAQLRDALPTMAIDPDTHLLQIVGGCNGDVETTPVTQTLTQATLDDYCKVRIEKGFERRFLDAQGRVASPAEAISFTKALSDAVAGVNEQYAQLLVAFWAEPLNGTRTRRDLGIESIRQNLRRDIYTQRHSGVLDKTLVTALMLLLERVSDDLPSDTAVQCHRLTIRIGDSAACSLAGTFAITQADDNDDAVLWFSTDQQLMRFDDTQALAKYFETASARQQLRPGLAIEDQPMLRKSGQVQITLERIVTPLFAERLDSIIALQARNLRYVTGLSRMVTDMTAMIDDALDVRQLLDPRLLQLNEGRWRREAPIDFADVWLKPESVAAAPAAPVEMILSASWRELAQTFDSRTERLRRLDNVLLDFTEQALQRYVCVLLGGDVQARNLRVHWLESSPVDPSDVETLPVPVSESQQALSRDLLSWLLECVTGHRSRTLPAAAQVRLDASTQASGVQIELINHMLGKLADGFLKGYEERFKTCRLEVQRQGDRCYQLAAQALSLREDAVRLDLAVGKRQERFDDAAFSMVRQVLDRPVRSLRTVLGIDTAEAFTVSLVYGTHPAIAVCDALVVRQPLKQDGALMLWRGSVGWQPFDSLEQLQATLQDELGHDLAERWLTLVATSDRAQLQTQLAKVRNNAVRFRLERVEGHAIEALQQAASRCERREVKELCLRAVRCRFEAGMFIRLADATELNAPLISMLDRLALRIENSIFVAMMPSWLAKASSADLKLYYRIFRRFYLASDGGKDFLFDLPSLNALARERLVTQLNKDYPGQALDPDQIAVTSRRYVSALPALGDLPSAIPAATISNSESLTQYAVNRFIDAQDTALSIDSEGQAQAVQLLTPDYLTQLVRRLDVGAAYRALLRKALSPNDAQYRARERCFIQQLPPALLAVALTERMQGKLSQRAYDFISSVVNMPDGIAREKVDDVRVILSPLQLLADKRLSPDTVSGVYLIAPADADKGPVLLYATYHSDFIFREYTDRTTLVSQIRSDGALQQLLLERLDPAVHRRYANGGFHEPHLASSVGLFDFDVPLHRPGPVALSVKPIKGNALQTLFKGTCQLLLQMGQASSVTTEEADRAGRAFLATLTLSQALALLPSKLATLLTLWQSHTLIRASVRSMSGRHWGQALSEFTSALGLMLTTREQSHDSNGSNAHEAGVSEEEVAMATAFSWSSSSLTAEQQQRLQGLEAQDVALDTLHHDSLLNLYLDKTTDAHYAVVTGRVYQVKRVAEEGRWMIVGAEGCAGPRLLLDNNQHWQLDLNLRLRGGGGTVSRIKTSITASSAEHVLIIEASGMPEIRLHYRDRARQIGEAHLQAKQYLENCLDNLATNRRGAALDPRVASIIGDFFGSANPDQPLLSRIERTVKALFDEIMDPSLSPFSSERFVMGVNRPGSERVTAFVIMLDPQRRIFLTERFFNVRTYRLKPQAARQGFKQRAHFQATTLLHELSHLALDTKDIAYLQSNAPHLDLLPQNTPGALRRYSDTERLHNYRLSHRSRKSDLFVLLEDGKWRALKPADGLGYSSILRITRTKTLDEARDVFLSDVDKRSQVMLKNADSVALLISHLGRRNYALTTP